MGATGYQCVGTEEGILLSSSEGRRVHVRTGGEDSRGVEKGQPKPSRY